MSGLSSHGSQLEILEGMVYVPIMGVDNIGLPDSTVVTKRVSDLGKSYKDPCAVGVIDGGQSSFSGYTDFISGNHDLLNELVHNPEFAAATPDEFANFTTLSAADRKRSFRVTFNQFDPVKTWDFVGVLEKFTTTLAAEELAKAAGTIQVGYSTAIPV